MGVGGFGKVWKVFNKKTKKVFALKEMDKAKIIYKKSVEDVIRERAFLSQLYHPFLVNMAYSFQDRDYLYIALEYLPGGDLRYATCIRFFSEEEIKFMMACLILSLEYLHSNQIIHRDIKPENLIFDKQGYLHLTDLGIAMKESECGKSSSGTIGYIAPEALTGIKQTYCSDYFSMGCICYELMLGVRPYLSANRTQYKQMIMAKQVSIKAANMKPGWSLNYADFINRLIQRKEEKRLGNKGDKEVKNHTWIKDFNWKDLYNKKLTAPYIPNLKEDNYDERYIQFKESREKDLKGKYQKIRANQKYKTYFTSFEYFSFENKIDIKRYLPNLHEQMYFDDTPKQLRKIMVPPRIGSFSSTFMDTSALNASMNVEGKSSSKALYFKGLSVRTGSSSCIHDLIKEEDNKKVNLRNSSKLVSSHSKLIKKFFKQEESALKIIEDEKENNISPLNSPEKKEEIKEDVKEEEKEEKENEEQKEKGEIKENILKE
ncbi:MAG: serine/threonine-protein kinase, partial [archaeon]|nr:serine/threonine-protein kinase [archaeon]